MRINTNRLKALAAKSRREQRHSSIIYRHGTPLGGGFNSEEDHAEEDALVSAGLQEGGYNGCVMVNIRLTRANKVANSKPCLACQDILRQRGFRKVLYSTNEGTFEELYL